MTPSPRYCWNKSAKQQRHLVFDRQFAVALLPLPQDNLQNVLFVPKMDIRGGVSSSAPAMSRRLTAENPRWANIFQAVRTIKAFVLRKGGFLLQSRKLSRQAQALAGRELAVELLSLLLVNQIAFRHAIAGLDSLEGISNKQPA